MISEKWEWTINAVLIAATVLNIYQAYDWWKTTQKLRQMVYDNEIRARMLDATKQAYHDLMVDLQRKGVK